MKEEKKEIIEECKKGTKKMSKEKDEMKEEIVEIKKSQK